MIKLLKQIFFGDTKFDRLVEGVYAHQYQDLQIRQEIKDQYEKKWEPVINPFTKPELYDPLNPPKGWIYDPYYETWIELNE